ncbi:MAG TPA: hypothetical protein VJP86_12225 [Vicinamibacterales bacterium]|jgi:hypothetical protein|nr:hypothetical protein [Vicinamibacterales bacterium]
MTRRLAIAVLLALAAAASFACGDDTPSNTPTPTTPVTQIFASNIVPKGTAVRFFASTLSGTVTAKLTSLSQSVPMGLGIGLGTPDTRQCYLNTQVTTEPGADTTISTAIDPGYFCVRLWDLGNLTDTASFSITLTSP